MPLVLSRPCNCSTLCVCVSPPGGRLNIHVTSEGLTKENGVFPDLRVTLRSQELHAPLIERMVELPVDITAGLSP